MNGTNGAAHRIRGGLAGGAVLFAATCFALDLPHPEWTGRGLFDKQSVDVGTIEPGVRTNLFRIRNAGAAPLQILKLIPTCPCVKGFAEKTAIATNSEATVIFELNAALLSGSFKRDLWVETDDPKTPRVMLSVTGTVKPLFSGLPDAPASLVADERSGAWTNRYTLAPSQPGLTLGDPQILTDAMQVQVSVETNRHAAGTEYVLTVVAATAQSGKSSARVLFPVSNGTGASLPPAVLTYYAMTGAELSVNPPTLLVYNTGKKVTRRLRVHTSDQNVSADKLAWQPHLKGVDVKVEPSKSKTGLTVVLDISQQAALDLFRQKDTKVTFSYPNHEPAVLALVPTAPDRATP